MSKKQTAVSYFNSEVKSLIDGLVDGTIGKLKFEFRMKALFESSLAKEKEQIIDAYWAGINGSINDYSEAKEVGNIMIDIKFGKGAEQYYTETYEQ